MIRPPPKSPLFPNPTLFQSGDEPLGSAYDPFPLDRNHAVVTREPTQLLALTSHSAFVRASRSLAPRSDAGVAAAARIGEGLVVVMSRHALGDRKSTRLNSSHSQISYAVFCLKKK